MSRYVSSKAPVSVRSLKRKATGSVVARHYGRVDVRFTRVTGGWLREREDFSGLSPEVVSSDVVANECNRAVGRAESWAKVY